METNKTLISYIAKITEKQKDGTPIQVLTNRDDIPIVTVYWTPPTNSARCWKGTTNGWLYEPDEFTHYLTTNFPTIDKTIDKTISEIDDEIKLQKELEKFPELEVGDVVTIKNFLNNQLKTYEICSVKDLNIRMTPFSNGFSVEYNKHDKNQTISVERNGLIIWSEIKMKTNKTGSNIGTGTEPTTQKPNNTNLNKKQEALNMVKESSDFLGKAAQHIIMDLLNNILTLQEKDVITNYSEQIEQKQTLKETLDEAIDAYEDLIGERDRVWSEKGKELTPTKKELANIIFKTMNIMKTMGLDIKTVLQDEFTALYSTSNTEHHPTPKTLQKGE